MSLKTGEIGVYPYWLRDLFAIFTATYGLLWSNQFVDDEIVSAIKKVWWMNLKCFEKEEILHAALEAAKKYNFPPKISEIVSMIESFKKEKERKQYFIDQTDKKLQLIEKNALPTRKELEAKLQMWEKLGNSRRADECMRKIAGLDMQKE